MGYRLKPIVQKIINLLRKEGFEIQRFSGSHISINRNPPLKRPIVIPNKSPLSNAVRLNLIKELKEAGIDTQKIEELF
jgi:predicted RNA binding protein YcfA (HicA-like mRNA interferase family)